MDVSLGSSALFSGLYVRTKAGGARCGLDMARPRHPARPTDLAMSDTSRLLPALSEDRSQDPQESRRGRGLAIVQFCLACLLPNLGRGLDRRRVPTQESDSVSSGTFTIETSSISFHRKSPDCRLPFMSLALTECQDLEITSSVFWSLLGQYSV